MRSSCLFVLPFVAISVATGCRKPGSPVDVIDPGDSGVPGDSGDSGVRTFTDFPADPVNVDVPATVPGLFNGSTGTSAAPCLSEPSDGSLFPNDWLPPRFAFEGVSGSGQNVFEIRVHSDRQTNDLIVYTQQH